MKKLSILALAAAGLLLGACSSDKDVVAEGSAVYSAKGEGYIGFQISLPSSEGATTRANDDFNNGTEDEFLVHSAKLFIFKGAKKKADGTAWSEGDTYDEVATANAATILQVQDFAGVFENDTQGAQAEDDTTNPQALNTTTKVTTTSVAVAKIDKVEVSTNEEIFGYVVINPGSTDLGSNPAAGTTFATWASTVIENATTAIGGSLNGVISDNGLLMTNAPTSTYGGGDATPTSKATTDSKTVVLKTAVKLDPESIKDNLAAAKSNPAGCVYVERAAAKVTLTDGISAANKKITKDGTNYTISLDGWQVINTEPSFYNVRKVDAAWNDYASAYHVSGTPNFNANKHYRFITKDAFAPTLPSATPHNEAAYRTYFAQDPQYSTDATLANTVAVDATEKWNSFTGRAYVPENTFDVEHQNWKNTTQVTVKVTVTGPGGAGADFVTLSDDDALYTPAGAEARIQNVVSSLNDVRTFLTEAARNISHYKSKDGNQTVTATIGIKLPRNGSDAYDLTAGTNAYTASVSFAYTNTSDESVTTNENDITENVSDSAPLAIYNLTKSWIQIKTAIEAYLTATVYKGGVSYYNARIQHFGEYETPWSASNFPYTTALKNAGITENSTAHIYNYNTVGGDNRAAATQNFLGRYGVVRDNWYNLTITEIKKLGSATPINMSDKATADDEINEEYYISAHVHILPWVLRTQTVKF